MTKTETDKYVRLIEDAGIFSYSCVKGTFILPPRGLVLWEQIRSYLDARFSLLGIENVSLPALIPASLLAKEQEHIAGFAPELFFVSRDRHSAETSDQQIVLRPTSEVLFYEWFARTLRTHKQLPLLYNQWGQVFRVEKNTRPFFRNTEFLWQEGHTLHKNATEANKFSQTILNVYRDYVEKILCIAVIVGIKTSREKFAGALESYTIECLLPDFQCLQLATSHYFGEQFSKAFLVNFHDEQNQLRIPSSTSWGTSTRSLGAVSCAHSDELGPVFPFRIAPTQLAFIQHPTSSAQVSDYFVSVYDSFSRLFRCRFYNSSSQIGRNLAQADKEGCPLKIIIGEHEFREQTVTCSTRIASGKKILVKVNQLEKFIADFQEELASLLYQRSLSLLNKNTFYVGSYSELVELTKLKKGIYAFPFCNLQNCEDTVKKTFPSLSFRCMEKTSVTLPACLICSRGPAILSYLARSY